MSRIPSGLHGPFEKKPGINGSSYRMGRNGLELAFIEQRLVDAFTKEVSKPSLEAKKLINDIFGERIKIWTDGNFAVGENLIQTIYTQCLDDGVAVAQTFNYEVENRVTRKKEKHTLIEPGHAILNRKAMLTELKTRTGFQFDQENQEYKIDKNFKILPLDLQGFREADLQGAGDYDLNIFTRQLNLAVEKIVKELRIDPKDLVLGRYGGDEFYVVIIENTDKRKVNPFKKADEIKNIIIDTSQSADGFFGEDEPTKFTIKDADKVEYIALDKMDPVSRMIYLNSLNEDLVLGVTELQGEHTFVEESLEGIKENILEDVGIRKKILEFLSRNNGNPYPKDVNDITEDVDAKTKSKILVHNKIKYLTKGHNELNLPYILAEDLDAKDEGNRVTQLLDFYQNYLIDPLLNKITMSRLDIFSHIKRGEFSNIYAFELKMKEINDSMSYVYGDKTINKLWQDRFREPIRTFIENGKIRVGRVGGMIVLGEVKDSVGLNQQERKLLEDPLIIESEFKGINEKHEIGYTKIEIPKDIDHNPESFKKVVEDMFNKPTEDWLRKTFRRIIGDDIEFDEFKKALKDKKYDPSNKITVVSARYFDSIKRMAKRIPVAHEILKELRPENVDKIEEIYTLLTLIQDEFGWVWKS